MFKGNVGRKGDPFQGPKGGSCLTPGNELSEETHADEIRDFTGKGLPDRTAGSRVREPREHFSATCFAVSGFMMLGLISGLSLVSHSNSGSFLVACTSLSQDGFQQGFWDVGRTYGLVSPLSF